jgi:8-oxo-dGTP diphosphatase
MKKVVSAAVINCGRILLVRKGSYWILPGGKPEGEESDLECLAREVGEELSGTKLKNVRLYGSFKGFSPIKGDFMENEVYSAQIDGPLNPVREGDSVSEYSWMNKSDLGKYILSEITQKVVDSLKTSF